MIHRQRRRAGFTLIEMLVVILIMSVLAGLVGAAIMNWIDSQRVNTTETTIATVNKALRQQMKAVSDEADRMSIDSIPASVRALAAGAGEIERARVIWKKLKLRQAFPMTYAEALSPHLSGTFSIPAADLPPLARFVRALKGKTPNAKTESSVCLLLALEQDRGGTSLSGDSLGNAVTDTDGDGLKEIVDAWGTPLAFYRSPTSHAELHAKNPAAPGSKAARLADPLDPEGTLLHPAWFGDNMTPPPPNRQTVQALTHQISVPNSNPAVANYTIAVIVSAGKDTRLGLSPNTMQIVSPGTDATDNIYSFRLSLSK